MTGAPDGPSTAELRAAVQREIQTATLRATAHAIGMSAPGLRSFLAGAEPRPATRRKILVWQAKRAAVGGLPYGMALSILRLLTEHLPPERAREVQRQVVADVRRASDAAGIPPPTWVREAEEDDDDGEG